MLSLLALLGLAHASDVLVPTFTPSTLSDFRPAERLTEETLQALVDRGVPFVAPSEIQRRAGAVADGLSPFVEDTGDLFNWFEAGTPGSILQNVSSAGGFQIWEFVPGNPQGFVRVSAP